jgi:hypothetical protein
MPCLHMHTGVELNLGDIFVVSGAVVSDFQGRLSLAINQHSAVQIGAVRGWFAGLSTMLIFFLLSKSRPLRS